MTAADKVTVLRAVLFCGCVAERAVCQPGDKPLSAKTRLQCPLQLKKRSGDKNPTSHGGKRPIAYVRSSQEEIPPDITNSNVISFADLAKQF